MKLGVVTPVFRAKNKSHLLECLQSVRGQVTEDALLAGHTVWHHVQDGGSTDGTAEVLREWAGRHAEGRGYAFTFSSEPDRGMYDAINKGLERLIPATDWILHLNADEQVLPGSAFPALAEGAGCDVVLANTIVMNEADDYICSRRPFQPWRYHARVWIPAQTCASFYSAEFLGKSGVRFNIRWRAVADKEWYIELMTAGARFRCVDRFTSLFRATADNLGFAPVMDEEKKALWSQQPAWIRKTFRLFVCHLKLRRVWGHAISRKIREVMFFSADGLIKTIPVRDRLRWGIKGWSP